MERGQMVLVKCTIESGAFSGELVFRVTQADGRPYSGVAPVHYFFNAKRAPIGEDRPKAGREMSGFITAFLAANGGDQATVEFPDGEAIRVALSQIPYRLERGRESQYVPV